MSKKTAQVHPSLALTLLIIFSLVACASPTATQTQPHPPLQDQPTAAPPLTGPAPYPTPGAQITSWNTLIDATATSDVKWETYQGELESGGDTPWKLSFQYPTDWFLAENVTPTHVYFQNMPEFQGPPPSTFAKFEVVRLSEPLTLTTGEIYIPTDFDTVSMLGQPAVLYTRTDQPEQVQSFTISFQYEGAWIVAAGYIFLPQADETELAQYRSILLTMASTLKLTK
jgi:hypothetical protein